MLIDYENRAIFFHNVKCGGVYMRSILEQLYNYVSVTFNPHYQYNTFFNKNYPIDKIQEGTIYRHCIMLQGKYRYYETHQDINNYYLNSFFKFIFVRNPYDKLYSVYCHLKSELEQTNNKEINTISENKEYYSSFDTFVKNRENINKLAYFHAFIRQYDQLINTSGNTNFEFIGKFENLENEFIEVLTLIGEKDIYHIEQLHKNWNPNKISNTNAEIIMNKYTEDVFLFVNNYFDLDFKIFNYKKYDTYSDFKANFLLDKMGVKKDEKIVEEKEDTKIKIPYYFVNIPDKIIAKKPEKNISSKIPKIIMQTYKDNYIHPFIYTNIQRVLNTNPNYDYYFITDETILPLIQNNFEPRVLNAFLSIKSGAAKSDFIRYIFLYLYGGIYYDLDVDINMNLDTFIKPDADFIFFTIIDNKPHQHSIIEQFIIMISKENSIMKHIIDEMVTRILKKTEENIFLTTGPRMFEDVIYNLIENQELYNIRQLFTTEQKRNFVETHRKCTYNNYTGYLFNIDMYNPNFTIIKPKIKGYQDKMLYYNRFKYGELNLSIYSEVMKEKKRNDIIKVTNYTDLYKKICLFIYNLELKKKQQNDDNYLNLEINKLFEIKDILYNNYKTYLLEKYPIKICNKCHQFKAYNETAFNAHTYFCSK